MSITEYYGNKEAYDFLVCRSSVREASSLMNIKKISTVLSYQC